MIARLTFSFFLIHIKYVVFMSLNPALLRFWFKTDLGRKNSASYLTIQAVKTFSYHGHALVTLYVQFLCSDWSKFDRWVYAENLCSILTLTAEADRVLCQRVIFLTAFFHWMYKMKYSCCYFLAGLFIGFWLRNVSLVKVGNPISDGIVAFHIAWSVRWPYLMAFRSCISNGKPE